MKSCLQLNDIISKEFCNVCCILVLHKENDKR